MDEILDRTWNGMGEAWEWLRGVILGEWEDNRSTSQVVSDALAGMVPGIGSIITLRDLIAVIVRLAKHPEKREDVDEWILLVAMLFPLIITVLGAVVAGVGALVGAELGGFLRAVALMLVKKGGVGLKAILEFLQGHGYGNAAAALGEIKFSRYRQAVVDGLNAQIDKLANLVRGFQSRLKALSPDSLPRWLPGRARMMQAIAGIPALIKQLEELRATGRRMIPLALIAMDNRLAALLAGDLRAAAQTTHTITTGLSAPPPPLLEPHSAHGGHMLRTSKPPEPHNTRRQRERRFFALAGKREYKYVGPDGRPVGAQPYQHGVTQVDNPPLKEHNWDQISIKTREGWPDLAKKFAPNKVATDYANFSRDIRAASIPAGSTHTLKRVVAHDKPDMDIGSYYNRDLPLDGHDLRAGSSVKEPWNTDGEYVELTVPPAGHPVWKELHALQEQSAGTSVRYSESLKYWEGPAASQIYEIELKEGRKIADRWFLPGGKTQQFFDRKQLEALKSHGFISKRKPSSFADFDPTVGNIVPTNAPYFEVIPLNTAIPPAKQ